MRQIVEALGIKPQFDTDTIPKDLVSLVTSYTLSLTASALGERD